MTPPLIGIPCRPIEDLEYEIPAHGVCSSYVDSVRAAGGNPILLPLTGDNLEFLKQYVTLCDGFLFTGGEDVDPKRYGATRHPSVTKTSNQRDDLEINLFNEIQKQRKPILGVCRGLQLINIALGGSLHQDIGSSQLTTQCHVTKEEKWAEILHSVTFEPNTRLADVLGSTPKPVNSLHHQCIEKLGRNLIINARSQSDGIIEGIESPPASPWILAVQWHPEVMWQDVSVGGAGLLWNLNLFKALVQEAGRGA